MITQQDITKLKKTFATKAEMAAGFAKVDKRFSQMDQRFDKIEKDSEEQKDALAVTLNEMIKAIHALEAEQAKLSHLVPIMYKTLTSHEGRLTGLESKILLS